MTAPSPHPVPDVSRLAGAVLDEVERAVVGKRDALSLVLAGVLAGGHVLIEDLPGLGKTLAARSFAQTLGLRVHPRAVHPRPAAGRPDRLVHLRPARRRVRLPRRAAVHRAAARRRDQPDAAQDPVGAARGDAGAARSPSRARRSPLEAPFHVLATANPVEYEGTYPLPEAQLDRFLMRVAFGYPTPRPRSATCSQRRLRPPPGGA